MGEMYIKQINHIWVQAIVHIDFITQEREKLHLGKITVGTLARLTAIGYLI